jgi:hypothetical protein
MVVKPSRVLINNAKIFQVITSYYPNSKNTWASFECFLVVVHFLDKNNCFFIEQRQIGSPLKAALIHKRRHFENKFIGGK